jgi:hypothetical protein
MVIAAFVVGIIGGWAGGLVIGKGGGTLAHAASVGRPPASQLEFKAAVLGKTREQIQAAIGAPNELNDPGDNGWDGPCSNYKGPFTDEKGIKAKKARVYFRRSLSGTSVADLVDFID